MQTQNQYLKTVFIKDKIQLHVYVYGVKTNLQLFKEKNNKKRQKYNLKYIWTL